MAELTLYSNPMSRGMIAHWMLAELGRPFDIVNLDYETQMKTPDYLAINPMGKVPALVHHAADGDRVVTEAAAICAYVAEAFPEAGLLPDAKGRAPYYRWLFFAAGPVEQAVVNKALGVEVPEDRQKMAGYGSFEQAVAALEGAVPRGSGWIAGDRFTAADVYVGSQVDWGLKFKTLPERPAFVDYAGRLRERPAYRTVFPNG